MENVFGENTKKLGFGMMRLGCVIFSMDKEMRKANNLIASYTGILCVWEYVRYEYA